MDFNEKCYQILAKVPRGKVVSYKEIALALHCKAYRAVGRAMKKNHDKRILCYKVVRSSGEVGGFNRGRKEKIRLLRRDGIEVKNGKIDIKRYGWKI